MSHQDFTQKKQLQFAHESNGAEQATFTGLYTPEQRRRRDSTVWTTVQGVLAAVQFIVFLISLALIARTLLFAEGYALATASIILKALILYTIMITGSIWEKVVFGRYLFAPAFFWEDVVSMLVIALHTAYMIALVTNTLSSTALLWLALAAYAVYAVNAAQFLYKLRKARLESRAPSNQTQTLARDVDNTSLPMTLSTGASQ